MCFFSPYITSSTFKVGTYSNHNNFVSPHFVNGVTRLCQNGPSDGDKNILSCVDKLMPYCQQLEIMPMSIF